MTAAEIEAMYRLLAIAKYEDRYVIPAAHAESAAALEETASGCSLDVDGGPGMGGGGRFGSSSGRPMRAAVETFHALRNRQTADNAAGPTQPSRVNLLNWDGNGAPPGLFPPEPGQDGYGEGPEAHG